jgi:predicted HNH restriction endonuclease
MTEDLNNTLESSDSLDKEAFIKEAVAAFTKTLNEADEKKHAVFLVYDEADGRLQTYTFNANLRTLLMMITSAYEMINEAEGGEKRVLN